MIKNKQWAEKVAKIIDPDNTFLNECDGVCRKRFGEDYKSKQTTLLK